MIISVKSLKNRQTTVSTSITALITASVDLSSTEKIAPALEYIAKNYTKSITNETLASLTGMSCVYFRKLFTEIMGESPIAYAHALRIKKARQMLKSDHGTISDIAYSLGYSNIFDFSRDFKKHTGIPPSKY